MIVRKPSSQSIITSSAASTSSSKSSEKDSSAYTDECCDADDEDAMSTEDSHSQSRPISVAIPAMGAHAPYCPRRPTLREILANTSAPPWTLAAFMAYLSNNHCLETLEFTMDAGRYKKHYQKMMSRASSEGMPPQKDRDYVQALWQRLVEAYIQPNGSREVNLPSSVRDPIVRKKQADMPPSPETLDPAVAKIYELMEDSVLVPFLNSVYPQTTHATGTVNSCPSDTSDDSITRGPRTYDDRTFYTYRSRQGRASPPPQTAVEPYAHSYSPSARFRQSAPLPLTAPPHNSHNSRFSVKLTPATSSPMSTLGPNTAESATSGSEANISGTGSTSGGPGMTDDSGSNSSPTGESPMTPPISPPSSDYSPKRDSGMWKKLGRLSGMKVGKKKSHVGLAEQ